MKIFSSTSRMILIIVFVLNCLCPFQLKAYNSFSIFEIKVKPVNGDFIKIGERITFQGQILLHSTQSVLPSVIGVEDPISRLTAEIQLDSELFFQYTTQSPASSPGIFAFLFFFPLSDTVYKKIYTLSVEPETNYSSDSFLISLEGFDPSIGDQGSELDEETNVICLKVENTNILNDSDIERSTLSYFTESFSEAISDYGKRYIKNLSTSPSTYIVLSGAAITCIASGGSLCIPAGLVVLQNLAATSLETDIEIIVDKSNLDSDTKEKIKRGGKIAIFGLFSVAGAKNLGGTLEFTSFSSKIAELTWENRPRIYDINYDTNGEITGYSIEVITNDGDLINYRADFWNDDFSDDNNPNAFKYWDTILSLRNGRQLLGNVISGAFNGIEYGIRPPTHTNFFSFIDKDELRMEIPKQDIISVTRKRISITNVIGNSFVRLNLGEDYGLLEGSILYVYRESKHIILQTIEKRYVGIIQILEVGEDNSKALVVRQFKGWSIRAGDYCQ